MTVQATVGGAVLGTGLGVGAGRVSGASLASVQGGPGRVVTQAADQLAVTGAGTTMLLLVAALMLLALGLLLRGLGQRHSVAIFAPPADGLA